MTMHPLEMGKPCQYGDSDCGEPSGSGRFSSPLGTLVKVAQRYSAPLTQSRQPFFFRFLTACFVSTLAISALIGVYALLQTVANLSLDEWLNCVR